MTSSRRPMSRTEPMSDLQIQLRMGAAQLHLDIVGVVLINIEDDQLFGVALAIWRHSSLPMEPPPPVTITTLPEIYRQISSRFT